MLASLKLELSPISNEAQLGINMSSLFHGCIMELVDRDYANQLHISEIRPFSQNLYKDSNGKWIWAINTLNEEAYEKIIKKLVDINDIYLKHKDLSINITNHKIKKISFSSLFEKNYYSEQMPKFITFQLITPTAFKSNGRYINHPDLRLIFNSIIRKYDFNSTSTKLYEENLIDELCQRIEITKYNLRSTYFYLEGIKIPSFYGKITIKVNSNQTMINLVNMLIEFAQYSGIGIKNALGMGGLIKL